MTKLAVPKKYRDTIEACVNTFGPCESDLHAFRVINHLMWEHAVELPTLIDRLHPENRPTIMLHEGDKDRGIPTVWLLGWSQHERTGMHGHGESAVAIGVLQGNIVNEDFRSFKGQKSYIRKGSVFTLPEGVIHDVYGMSDDPGQRDVTVHAYWPPLSRMDFYDDNGEYESHWAEDPKEQAKDSLEYNDEKDEALDWEMIK